jgi:hypothetical protein
MTKQGTKTPKPYRSTKRYGILNHLGDLWTPETFVSKTAANAYLRKEEAKNSTWDLSRHRVIPVRVTVSALTPR